MSDEPNKTKSIKHIKEYLEKYIRSQAIGLLEILNLHSKLKYKVDAISLFLTQPRKLIDILMEVYGSTTSSTLILKLFFIKPLLAILASNEMKEEELILKETNIEKLCLKIEELLNVVKNTKN